MSLLDTLTAILAPYECLSCTSEGKLVCEGCAQFIAGAISRCYKCSVHTTNYQTCKICRTTSPLASVKSAAVYDGLAKDLLWCLKSGGAQAAAREMAEQMAGLVQPSKTELILVPVPTASRRVRQRGYDQATLIARALARRTGVPCRELLRRHGNTQQVGASREQRLRQLSGAFSVRRPPDIALGHIILIDDVLTTGATLEVAASVLMQAGAKRVDAITYAQA